jgi:glycosyltransferase involved in cell wall biosynthesis
MAKRVLFVITEDWALISHRLHLIESAIAAGYEVGLVTKINRYRGSLESRGIKIFQWKLNRGSLNPIQQIITLLRLCQVLWKFRPDIIHAVAQKPVIYSGLARKLFCNTAFIGTLGGVGFIFTGTNLKAKLLKPIVVFFLKWAFTGKKTRLILQNEDNINTIKKLNIVDYKNIRLIRGAGVEMQRFISIKAPSTTPIIILPGRMLWDKGVGEFVRVAKRIKAINKNIRFVLVGDIDIHNPKSLSQAQINKWVSAGIIEQWSRCDNMETIYEKASIVCLPSYNEGLPKVLIEAGSCARPIVTFDVPGCREVVQNGVNGFLVEFGNEKLLEQALIKLINDKKLCAKMGKEGRKTVKTKFSSQIINHQTLNIWKEVS